jgi:hypothetical protein
MIKRDDWTFAKGPRESRLRVVTEVKSPSEDWVEIESREFGELGTYELHGPERDNDD